MYRAQRGAPKGYPGATKHRTLRVLYAQGTPSTVHSLVWRPRGSPCLTPKYSGPTSRSLPPAPIGETKSTGAQQLLKAHT